MFLCLLFVSAIQAQEKPDSYFSKQLFNDNWKFIRNEFIDASAKVYNDKSWRTLKLPHDWAIEGPFAEEFGPRSGGLPIYGTGWYRKYFSMPSTAKGKQVLVHFDGAMNNAEVWVNGKKAGGRPYGYSSFALDIAPFLTYGGSNTIAVKLSPKDLSSRWYPGAGIYRNVWLEVNEPLHVAHWGVSVTTPEITDRKATVRIVAEAENSAAVSKNAELELIILDATGKKVAATSAKVAVGPNGKSSIDKTLTLDQPQRWDMDRPYLYRAVVRTKENRKVSDAEVVPFGVRTIEFTAKEGFLLNRKKHKLNGVCLHSDLGPLGSVVNRRGLERQLEIMKEMGVNALRTSHNPPSPEQLQLCDSMGIVVIAEAFDTWEMKKVPNDYGNYFKEWHERDLVDMIKRDRNHPSVIMWSIGNEILEQGKKDGPGPAIARELSRIAHETDPTRPTTAAFNYYPASVDNKLAHEVDIKGFNYKPTKYEEIMKNHPDWVIMGSETESVVSTRDVYHFPIEKYTRHSSRHITSYDIVGPPWAYPPDIEFHYQEKFPNVVGQFVWTGFDYLGEPTPFGGKDNDTQGGWKGDWVSRSSYFGIVDLVGFPKDRYYLYQSQWTTKPMIHLLPHWNWKGMEGKTIPVYSYTNCDEAELFVNGKSMGKKVKGKDRSPLKVDFIQWQGGEFMTPYRLLWEVPYQPGSIKVVGYKNGKAVVEKEIKTAGEPAKISLQADKKVLTADGYDLSYVTVRIEDKDGNLCPDADNMVYFDVTGAGAFEAVGNGNQATTLLFNQPYRPAFKGLCMLIVRSKAGEKGEIKIQTKSEGLQAPKLTLESK